MSEAAPTRGELVIQTIAMPKDANRNGDIFGGWVVSQMDLGGAILAATFWSASMANLFTAAVVSPRASAPKALDAPRSSSLSAAVP